MEKVGLVWQDITGMNIVLRNISKFYKIFSKHQKIRALELFVLMIIGGFVEMLSVSLVIPFVELIMSSGGSVSNGVFFRIIELLNIEVNSKFIVLFAFALAGIYFLKNIFLIFQFSVQNKFVYNNQFYTQQKLLHKFLHKQYDFYLGVESADILRLINKDTENSFFLLQNLGQLFTEIVVAGMLVVTVFSISPVITLMIVLFMVLFIFFILVIIRPFLRRASMRQQSSYSALNKWLLQAIQGIKVIKISESEEFFEDNFSENGKEYSKNVRIANTLGPSPRFLIEGVSMSVLFVAVGILSFSGTDMARLIPIVSAIAVSATRLLPSVNRISQALSNIAASEPYLDNMVSCLMSIDKNETDNLTEESAVPFEKEISIDSITYSYPGSGTCVLSEASMKICKGQSVGIVGTSGAGKTTTVDILLGLLKPVKGKVLLDGNDIELNIHNWLSQIGYIPQSIFILDGTVRDNVAFGIKKDDVDDREIWRALKDAALEEYVKNLPLGLDTELGEGGIKLSGGQRQRIGIARALYKNPSILFFDEATSSLDNETEAAIMKSINSLRGEKTLIIIAHRLSTIQDCDVLYSVEDRKIVRVR